MPSIDQATPVAQRQHAITLIGFRVFGGLEYHGVHSADFSLTPSGERGSATSWSLDVLPSALNRLRENVAAPNFQFIPIEQHFPRPMVFLFRWSPQLQLTFPTRIVAGLERFQLHHWSPPLEIMGKSYSWTIEQQLLDLDGKLVQSFRTLAVIHRHESGARTAFANVTAGWDQPQMVKRFLSATEEDELRARFQACKDLFPKTARLLKKAQLAENAEAEQLLAEALAELKTESLIYSALESEISDLSGEARRRFRRAQRELVKRIDPRDRRISDLWGYLKKLTEEQLQEFLGSLGFSGQSLAKSLRRRHQRLGLLSIAQSAVLSAAEDSRPKALSREVGSVIGFSLESFPERYVAQY
jgi:hypothetical protein